MYSLTEIELIARQQVRERTSPAPRLPRLTRTRRGRGDSSVA